MVPVLEALQGASGLDRHRESRGGSDGALDLGAEFVNDVTALRGDPELAGVVAEHGAYLCLMHMQGEPRTMQADPRYEDVVAEVAASSTTGSPLPSPQGFARSRSASTRASASARPSSTTSSSCAGSTS